VIKEIAHSLRWQPPKQPLRFLIECDIQRISDESGDDELVMPSPGYTDFRKIYYRSGKFFCSCDNLAMILPIRGTEVRRLQMNLILQRRFEYICNNPEAYCGFCISDVEAEKIKTEARLYGSQSQYRLSFLLRWHVRHESQDCNRSGSPETVIPCTPPLPGNSLLTPPKSTKTSRKNGTTVIARKETEKAETLEWNPRKGVLCKCEDKERSAIKMWGPPLDADHNEVIHSIPI
jgi:hypothetical protein